MERNEQNRNMDRCEFIGCENPQWTETKTRHEYSGGGWEMQTVSVCEEHAPEGATRKLNSAEARNRSIERIHEGLASYEDDSEFEQPDHELAECMRRHGGF